MREKLTTHIRRPHPFPAKGHWRIDCDCGWRGEISRYDGPRDLGRHEAEQKLEALFVEHIPADRRQAYLLVDQRPAEYDEGPGASSVPIANGNFIMPEGKPCTLLGWWEDGDTYRGRAQGFDLRDPVLELPIGEIRTADGRVFRMA